MKLYKPHIRKVDSETGWKSYHCSLQRNEEAWWHTYGETMRVAYEKMSARVAIHDGAFHHGPPIVEQHL